MAKRFNENQKVLYKALETISNGVLSLEDTVDRVNKMSREEVELVIAKFEDKITEFNLKDIEQDAYNFEGYAVDIITTIGSIMEDEEDE